MAEAKKGKTYYAVTAINHGSVDDNGKNSNYTVAAGEEVDQSKFEDDEFQALVDAGSVTTTAPEDQEDEQRPDEKIEKSATELAADLGLPPAPPASPQAK